MLGVNLLILWRKISLNQTALKKKYNRQKEALYCYIQVYEAVNLPEFVILVWTLYELELLFSENTQEVIFMWATCKKYLLGSIKQSGGWGWFSQERQHALAFWKDNVTCTWELEPSS